MVYVYGLHGVKGVGLGLDVPRSLPFECPLSV